MSRAIDMDNPDSWDADDIRYLRDRCLIPHDYDLVDEAEEGVEDYDGGWNNDERRELLAERGLSTEGKKEELIARLLAWDEEHADEDDD